MYKKSAVKKKVRAYRVAEAETSSTVEYLDFVNFNLATDSSSVTPEQHILALLEIKEPSDQLKLLEHILEEFKYNEQDILNFLNQLIVTIPDIHSAHDRQVILAQLLNQLIHKNMLAPYLLKRIIMQTIIIEEEKLILFFEIFHKINCPEYILIDSLLYYLEEELPVFFSDHPNLTLISKIVSSYISTSQKQKRLLQLFLIKFDLLISEKIPDIGGGFFRQIYTNLQNIEKSFSTFYLLLHVLTYKVKLNSCYSHIPGLLNSNNLCLTYEEILECSPYCKQFINDGKIEIALSLLWVILYNIKSNDLQIILPQLNSIFQDYPILQQPCIFYLDLINNALATSTAFKLFYQEQASYILNLNYSTSEPELEKQTWLIQELILLANTDIEIANWLYKNLSEIKEIFAKTIEKREFDSYIKKINYFFLRKYCTQDSDHNLDRIRRLENGLLDQFELLKLLIIYTLDYNSPMIIEYFLEYFETYESINYLKDILIIAIEKFESATDIDIKSNNLTGIKLIIKHAETIRPRSLPLDTIFESYEKKQEERERETIINLVLDTVKSDNKSLIFYRKQIANAYLKLLNIDDTGEPYTIASKISEFFNVFYILDKIDESPIFKKNINPPVQNFYQYQQLINYINSLITKKIEKPAIEKPVKTTLQKKQKYTSCSNNKSHMVYEELEKCSQSNIIVIQEKINNLKNEELHPYREDKLAILDEIETLLIEIQTEFNDDDILKDDCYTLLDKLIPTALTSFSSTQENIFLKRAAILFNTHIESLTEDYPLYAHYAAIHARIIRMIAQINEQKIAKESVKSKTNVNRHYYFKRTNFLPSTMSTNTTTSTVPSYKPPLAVPHPLDSEIRVTRGPGYFDASFLNETLKVIAPEMRLHNTVTATSELIDTSITDKNASSLSSPIVVQQQPTDSSIIAISTTSTTDTATMPVVANPTDSSTNISSLAKIKLYRIVGFYNEIENITENTSLTYTHLQILPDGLICFDPPQVIDERYEPSGLALLHITENLESSQQIIIDAVLTLVYDANASLFNFADYFPLSELNIISTNAIRPQYSYDPISHVNYIKADDLSIAPEPPKGAALCIFEACQLLQASFCFAPELLAAWQRQIEAGLFQSMMQGLLHTRQYQTLKTGLNIIPADEKIYKFILKFFQQVNMTAYAILRPAFYAKITEMKKFSLATASASHWNSAMEQPTDYSVNIKN